MIRHFRGPFHDVRKEETPQASASDSALRWEAIARDPTPDEEAQLAEIVALLMASLDERERQVLRMRLEGYKVREIAEQFALAEFTVQGVLRKIQRRLKRMRDEQDHVR